jgi:Putative peptidoglycan binding domain/Trypsin
VSRVFAKVGPLAGATVSGLALALALSQAARAAPIPAPTAQGQFQGQSQNSLLRPIAVFGPDQRTPLPQSYWRRASRIGVLHDPRSRSVCTAFCVAPDVVATAAHCLYRTGDATPLRLSDITVRLHGTHVTARVAGAAGGAPEANVIAGSQHLNVHPPIDATRDWALVRLAQPICKGGYFKLSRRPVEDVMRLADQGRVYNIAYHRDLPKWQPMIGRDCDVRRNFTDVDWPTIRRDFVNADQLLLHTCDTGAASSGSPLIVDGPNGPEVVGINVGTYVQSKVIMLNGEVVHRFKSDDVANTGVNSQVFAAALDSFRDANLLASQRDVRLLQNALAVKGLYKGQLDGRFGTDTKVAIEHFERAASMPVTGLATQPLLEALLGESEVVTGRLPLQIPASGTAPQR